jgi:hypothetical protein
MGRGKRYEGEPKLNFKKVIGVIVALLVIILVIVSIIKLVNSNKTKQIAINKSYYSAYLNGKFGVIDNNGDTVIEPSYDELVIVPNKLKAIFVCTYDVNDQTGEYKTKVINDQNQEIITGYDKVQVIDNFDSNKNIWYEDNVLKVCKDGKYGMVDFSGTEILPCEYDEITCLKGIKNNFLIKKDQKVGLVNEKGQIIINAEYSQILPLDENCTSDYIVVDQNNKYGLISTSGKTVLEVKYDEIKYLNNKTIFGVKEAGVWKAIDEDGKIVLDGGYDNIISANGDNIVVVKGGKYGVVSKTGEVKIEPSYEDLKYTFSIYYIAKQNGSYGIINLSNEKVIDFAYLNMNYVESAGFIKADKSDTETVVFDNNLSQKFTGIISEINLDKGYIKAYINGEYKYYNFKFEEKSSSDILTANSLFVNKKDGKYGYVDKSGKDITEYIYDDAKEQNSCGFAAVKKDGVWGSINQIGNEILTPSINLDNNIYIDFIGKWHLNDSGLYYEQ